MKDSCWSCWRLFEDFHLFWDVSKSKLNFPDNSEFTCCCCCCCLMIHVGCDLPARCDVSHCWTFSFLHLSDLFFLRYRRRGACNHDLFIRSSFVGVHLFVVNCFPSHFTFEVPELFQNKSPKNLWLIFSCPLNEQQRNNCTLFSDGAAASSTIFTPIRPLCRKRPAP